jgi:exodeoxyribonuclease VII small subunit
MAKKKTTSKTSQSQLPSFESSLESLTEVVHQLEDGQLSLSDSLEQYEQGVKHLKNCHAALKDAQRKIEVLVRIDKDGNLVTEDFDDSATDNVSVGTRKRSSGVRKKSRTAVEQELIDELEAETDSPELDDDASSLF